MNEYSRETTELHTPRHGPEGAGDVDAVRPRFRRGVAIYA